MPLATLEVPRPLGYAPVAQAGDDSDMVLKALQAQWNLPAVEPAGQHAPEKEIYGRSLSANRKLGARIIEFAGMSSVNSPEAEESRVEFYTSVQEGFGTDMELGGGLMVRTFDMRPVTGGRVMANDCKTAITKITADGLACAREKAKHDPHFMPQLIRSVWDHENALIVDKMARGETDYNTRIVVSAFPEEAAAVSGDEYWRMIGYVPHLKRGFVQLYHMTDHGLLTGSLSFDGSNKHQIREVFRRLGIVIPIDENTDSWLQYAYTGTFSKDQAKEISLNIADASEDPVFKENKRKAKNLKQGEVTNTIDVTEKYRPIMDRVFNELYIHLCESLVRGRQTTPARNLILQFANQAGNFNAHYANALYRMRANEQFTAEDSIVLHELLVYSTIEMMRALHLQEQALQQGQQFQGYEGIRFSAGLLQLTNTTIFQSMLGSFGADGARNNRTYSACGLSISLGDEDDSPQSPFGGKDKSKGEDQESGACDYVHTGCYCCPYNSDGSSRGSLMKVVARRESDGTAYCKRSGCGAWLSADGKSGDIGFIARRAQNRKTGSFALAA